MALVDGLLAMSFDEARALLQAEIDRRKAWPNVDESVCRRSLSYLAPSDRRTGRRQVAVECRQRHAQATRNRRPSVRTS